MQKIHFLKPFTRVMEHKNQIKVIGLFKSQNISMSSFLSHLASALSRSATFDDVNKSITSYGSAVGGVYFSCKTFSFGLQ